MVSLESFGQDSLDMWPGELCAMYCKCRHISMFPKAYPETTFKINMLFGIILEPWRQKYFVSPAFHYHWKTYYKLRK